MKPSYDLINKSHIFPKSQCYTFILMNEGGKSRDNKFLLSAQSQVQYELTFMISGQISNPKHNVTPNQRALLKIKFGV